LNWSLPNNWGTSLYIYNRRLTRPQLPHRYRRQDNHRSYQRSNKLAAYFQPLSIEINVHHSPHTPTLR
jgi:acyl-homoserine lactone acylase PvdQ